MMSEQEPSKEPPKYCPECGTLQARLVDSVFIEYGESLGDEYESEGDVDVYRCGDVFCAFEFADVFGIPKRDKPVWTSLLSLASEPVPKTTDQGI